MGDKMGSIAVGKHADLVIFDAKSPFTIYEGLHNPVTAIVSHSSPADVNAVIVAGVVRKQVGTLVLFNCMSTGEVVAGKGGATWCEFARELLRSLERFQKQAQPVVMD
ncbi:hypothetical protein LTR85_005500 [Meristemomyces frigidus]|nr:hypothetical protein LTR85_005500 [Meristemomyces frigidus]